MRAAIWLIAGILLSLSVCPLLAVDSPGAIEESAIAWGEPVEGLRLGLVRLPDPLLNFPAPLLTLVLENTTNHPISLPDELAAGDYRHAISLQIQSGEVATGKAAQDISGLVRASSQGKAAPPATRVPVAIAPGKRVIFASVPMREQQKSSHDAGSQYGLPVLLADHTYLLKVGLSSPVHVDIGPGWWRGKVTSGEVKLRMVAPSAAGIPVEAGFTMAGLDFFLGQPIRAVFTARNTGGADFSIHTGGDYVSTGRPGRFTITATDEKGEPVPDPITHFGDNGGFGGPQLVTPAKPYEESLLINQWCAFTQPGRYKIHLSRTLNLIKDGRDEGAPCRQESTLPQKKVEADFTITLRRDVAAQKRELDDLRAAMRGRQLTRADEAFLRTLAKAKSPELLPFLEEWLDLSSPPQGEVEESSPVFLLWEYGPSISQPIMEKHVYAPSAVVRSRIFDFLARDKSAFAKPLGLALLDPATERSALSYALSTSSFFVEPEYGVKLLQLASSSDDMIRGQVASALGSYPNDPAVLAALRQLLRDPARTMIPINAAESLHKLGSTDGVTVLIDLLGDASARPMALFTLRNITGKDFHENQAAWRQWWAGEQKNSEHQRH